MVPEKAIESTVGALFGHGEYRGHQKHRHRDREESTKSRCIKTKRDDTDSEEQDKRMGEIIPAWPRGITRSAVLQLGRVARLLKLDTIQQANLQWH